jgi:hypothetical protein
MIRKFTIVNDRLGIITDPSGQTTFSRCPSGSGIS